MNYYLAKLLFDMHAMAGELCEFSQLIICLNQISSVDILKCDITDINVAV